MGNHEYCEDCGKNTFHSYRPCDPEDVAKHQGIPVERAAQLRVCQPLDQQATYKEPPLSQEPLPAFSSVDPALVAAAKHITTLAALNKWHGNVKDEISELHVLDLASHYLRATQRTAAQPGDA